VLPYVFDIEEACCAVIFACRRHFDHVFFFEYCPFLRQRGSQTSLHTHAVESDVKNIAQSGAHDCAFSFFFLLRPHTERTYE
jgi:hypothetical protein